MAKAKKKEVLSLEEKLEQALVPVNEQPYEVPENWCWTRIQEICEFERGITFPASAKEHESTEENIACLRTANIQEELEIEDLLYVNRSYMKNNLAKLVRKNDIIMSSANSRELVGKASYVYDVNKPMTFGGFVLNIRAKRILSKYLFYMLRFEFLSGKFMGESTQTTNIANINTTTLGNYCFPLPPLTEQQRIVEQIESLFAKLDEVKEKINMCLSASYERRTLIFNKAFSGELTEAWRKERNVSNEWKTLRLEQMCEKITDGTHHSPTNTDKGDYMYVTAKNIKVTGIDLSHITYVSKAVHEEIYSRCDVKKGDVLYIKDGATTGIATVNTLEEQFSLLSSVAVLRPNDNVVLSEYLCFSLNSEKVKSMMIKNMSGSAITRLTLSKIKKAELAVCSLNEQCEIVKILKDVSMKEDMIEQVCNDVIIKIDVMKKSILAKAFRGELGTNNPDEESAVKLLKQIIDGNL